LLSDQSDLIDPLASGSEVDNQPTTPYHERAKELRCQRPNAPKQYRRTETNHVKTRSIRFADHLDRPSLPTSGWRIWFQVRERGKRKARTLIRATLLVIVVMNDLFLSAAVLILFLNDGRSISFPMLGLLDDSCAVPIDGRVLVRLPNRDASADGTSLNTNTHFIRN